MMYNDVNLELSRLQDNWLRAIADSAAIPVIAAALGGLSYFYVSWYNYDINSSSDESMDAFLSWAAGGGIIGFAYDNKQKIIDAINGLSRRGSSCAESTCAPVLRIMNYRMLFSDRVHEERSIEEPIQRPSVALESV